jgi:hypothetical protein
VSPLTRKDSSVRAKISQRSTHPTWVAIHTLVHKSAKVIAEKDGEGGAFYTLQEGGEVDLPFLDASQSMVLSELRVYSENKLKGNSALGLNCKTSKNKTDLGTNS